MDEPFLAEWQAWPERDAFVAEVGDRDLAFQIFLLEGSQSQNWLDREIPALDGTPRSCLKTKRGRKKLRSIAARFPR